MFIFKHKKMKANIFWLLIVWISQWQIIQVFKRQVLKFYKYVTRLQNERLCIHQEENRMKEYQEFIQDLHDMDRLVDSYIKELQAYAESISVDCHEYKRSDEIGCSRQAKVGPSSLKDEKIIRS